MKVIGIARLCSDPELRATPNGRPVATMRLASPRRQRAGEERGAVYFDCEVWGQLAETCHRYLRKGRLVLIDSRLEHSEWTSDAGKRQRNYVVADSVQFLDARGDADRQQHPDPSPEVAA